MNVVTATRLGAAMLCALLGAPAAHGAAADDALEGAKGAYLKLKKDDSKRKFRHNWLAVAKQLEGVEKKFSKNDVAAAAAYWRGELYSDLSRFSGSSDDADVAIRAYERTLTLAPKHRLGDDAALAAAKLAWERKQDASTARRLATAGLERAQDRKRELQSLLASLPAEKREVPKAVAKATAVAPMSEAVRRATKVLDRSAAALMPELSKPDAPQARRVALERRPAPEATDDVDETASASAIASLQEKLRDIRVGVRQADATQGERFKSLAKSEPSAELTLAQQLGLKVRRVVIDAGHGGHDTGAIGPNGAREKDVALSIALKLGKKLEAMGLEVSYTREEDVFVALEDRTKQANFLKGDLFISVHCNAAPSKALRGIETYSLNTSSNRYAIRLAARENATSQRGIGDLQYILADLATKANTGESTKLADRVQKSLIHSLSPDYEGIKDLGTKEALFYVLLGAKMPAILVETSFISNPEDEKRLLDDEYQEQVAGAISSGVDAFLEERAKIAQVD